MRPGPASCRTMSCIFPYPHRRNHIPRGTIYRSGWRLGSSRRRISAGPQASRPPFLTKKARGTRAVPGTVPRTISVEDAMSNDPDHTRRWLINASGAAFLSNAMAAGPSVPQIAGTPAAKAPAEAEEPAADQPISPVTTALCEYVAKTLDRDMPPDVVAKTKLHTLHP